MTQRAITRELARYIVDMKYEDLPDAAVEAAKEAVLDQVGIMLTGSTLAWAQPAHEVARDLGGRPECGIVGHATRVPAPDAAFVNAVFAHSCEFDDSSHDAACHPAKPRTYAAAVERNLAS